jgi:DNA-binding NtrC family response regulator
MEILVADAFEELVQLLSRILENKGYSVVGATSCDQALRLSMSCRPQVALLDCEMISSKGAAAFQSMEEANPGVKLILMSNFHEPRYFIGMGNVAAFLVKPFRVVELLDILEHLVSPRTWMVTAGQ